MKFNVVGFLCAYILQINGNLLVQEKNRSSSLTSKRPIRSLEDVKRNFERQECPECEDNNYGQCTRKKFFRVKRYSENELKCLPATTLVKLRLPGPEYSVEPSMAKIKRCTGYCRHGHGFHTCLPTKTSFEKVPVILTNHLKGATKCVDYEVERHEECACDCKIQKEHCTAHQKHEHCSCKCKNEGEKILCLENSNQKTSWDEESCQCVCEPEMCPHGLVWNYVECRCEISSDNDNALY